jgi:neutral ceramidase
VGGAYGDITPDHAMPNYNGEHLEPDKNATPLRVHAIILDDGTSRVAIISVDCTFLGRAEVGRIRDALHQRLGLKSQHVCIAATHSHASPATTASFLTGELPDPAYIELLVGQTCRAVEQAISRLKPARVVAASIEAPPIGFCRRRVDPTGQVYMTGTEPKSALSLPAENPIDERMQYAVFEDFDGRPLTVMFNFACHNNMVHRVFSADMFGRAGDELRARLGDVATVMLAAPCGDVAYRKPGGRPSYADDRAAGHAIADAILSSYKSQPRSKGGRLVVRSVVRHIPDRPYDAADFVYDNGRGSNAAARQNFQRRYTPEEAAVREKGPTQCDVEFQAIAFGDTAIVTNPAELFSIYGVKIKQASPFKVTFVSSLTNGYCGYVPTVKSFKHGGYETYRTVYTSRLAKDAGDRILQESIDLLRALHDR